MLSLALMLCASLPLAAADATATDDESLLSKIFDAFRPMVSRVLSNDAAKAHLWLQAAGRNLTYGASMRRPPLEAEDMPQRTPQLMRTFSRLDLGVAWPLNTAGRGSSAPTHGICVRRRCMTLGGDASGKLTVPSPLLTLNKKLRT